MLLASLVTNAAWAQDAPEVGRLFSREADLTSPGDGPYRLALSAEVLAACQPGLSDLRLYDGDGREVPWLLDDAGRVPTGTSERLLYVTAPALDATRTREGPPRAPTGFVETFAIAPPGEAPPRSEWSLLFDVRSSAFVAAIRVIETGADGTASTCRMKSRREAMISMRRDYPGAAEAGRALPTMRA